MCKCGYVNYLEEFGKKIFRDSFLGGGGFYFRSIDCEFYFFRLRVLCVNVFYVYFVRKRVVFFIRFIVGSDSIGLLGFRMIILSNY